MKAHLCWRRGRLVCSVLAALALAACAGGSSGRAGAAGAGGSGGPGAGSGGSSGSGGSGGGAGGAADGGSAPAPDAAGTDGAAADRAGAELRPPDSKSDGEASLPPGDGPAGALPAAVLLHTRATGYVHESIGPAAAALKRALGAVGIAAEISDDPRRFAPAQLARFGAVVLISTTGRPLGDPGAAGIEALVAFLRGGRGLVGVHAASNGHEDADAYVSLIGGDLREHPGNVRRARCYVEGTHPAVAQLPAIFEITDEFYVFNKYRADNQVVLRCDAFQSAQKLPIAWYRAEGAGRVFYTGLGHATEEWSDRRVVEDHVVPAVLWSLGR